MYLLDADVAIQPKNLYYDIAPGFWEWLLDAHDRGLAYTVDRVKQEVDRGQDDLTRWLADAPGSFCLPFEQADQGAIGHLMTWAQSSGFTPAAVNTFAASADLFLVAKAAARGWTVVSHETQADPNARKRIKIPNACQELGVGCIGLFELMRRERVELRR